MKRTVIGIDIAKRVFQLLWVETVSRAQRVVGAVGQQGGECMSWVASSVLHQRKPGQKQADTSIVVLSPAAYRGAGRFPRGPSLNQEGAGQQPVPADKPPERSPTLGVVAESRQAGRRAGEEQRAGPRHPDHGIHAVARAVQNPITPVRPPTAWRSLRGLRRRRRTS